jgi:tRNA modification GTPase
MIVRLSGADAWNSVARFCTPATFTPGRFCRCLLAVDGMACPITVYPFRGPKSFTGEDLIELHLPGNPLLAELTLRKFLEAGVRHADPGEFTARAFFHGKLDLTQAEGVAAAIAASDQASHRAARQLLGGEIARLLTPIMDRIAHVLAMTEAQIDFADEPLEAGAFTALRDQAKQAAAQIDGLISDSAHLAPLRHAPTAVLLGRPNAGKSTLLNALAQSQRAVISPIAGATRDALRAAVAMRRGEIELIDVAGLDEESKLAATAQPEIAKQMRESALRAAAEADIVILVRDCADASPPPPLPRAADLIVITKIDLQLKNIAMEKDAVTVSAQTGENLPTLLEALDRIAFGENSANRTLALSARALASINEGRVALQRYLDATEDSHATTPLEVQALELRECLDALGQVLGVMLPDEILGRIFSTFCIGK